MCVRSAHIHINPHLHVCTLLVLLFLLLFVRCFFNAWTFFFFFSTSPSSLFSCIIFHSVCVRVRACGTLHSPFQEIEMYFVALVQSVFFVHTPHKYNFGRLNAFWNKKELNLIARATMVNSFCGYEQSGVDSRYHFIVAHVYNSINFVVCFVKNTFEKSIRISYRFSVFTIR